MVGYCETQKSNLCRSEMKQMRDMLSYQTGLITGLQNTVSNLNTTVTTLYEDTYITLRTPLSKLSNAAESRKRSREFASRQSNVPNSHRRRRLRRRSCHRTPDLAHDYSLQRHTKFTYCSSHSNIQAYKRRRIEQDGS